MFEADALCDRIAVVAKGRIVAEGTPRELKERVSDGVVVEIEVYGIEDGKVEELRSIAGVTSVAVEDRDQAQVVVVQSAAGHEPTRHRAARRRRWLRRHGLRGRGSPGRSPSGSAST
jgi:ABC-2 type transport system ATP-binding protein